MKAFGRCARCKEPFGGNRATIYMVHGFVAQSIVGPYHSKVRVPVCAGCATPIERKHAEDGPETICAGCGLTMRSFVPKRVCSDRCRRRDLRARRRGRIRQCAGCSRMFRSVRSDARYCSAACKQRAHRLAMRRRSITSAPAPPDR
jgi:hypothetical protein